MKNLPELAEHGTNFCVGALGMGGAAAAGLSGVAVPLAALAAIGFQLRVSCARRGGLRAARALTEALTRAGELRSEDVDRALDLMKGADVARMIRPSDMAASAHGLPPGANVNIVLATPLADSLMEPGDAVHGVLIIAFSEAIAVLRQDEDFHRGLTQDLLVSLAQGQGVQLRQQQEIQLKLDSLQMDYRTLSAALKDHQRLRRDEMEAIASRFEIARVYDLSDDQLREQLELRAADFRLFHDQIEAIDERTLGLGNLKAAARNAAERLDFAEVEALLERVDAVETEVAAETKVLRGDNALLRGRSAEAFAMLSAAADSFASIDPLEPARRRLRYEDRFYAHGLRYGGEGLALSARMIRAALYDPSMESGSRLEAQAQNCLGVALWAQGERLGGSQGATLLGEAVAAYRDSLRVWTEATHPLGWARAKNNLGIALQTQGARIGGEEGAALLGEAVAAYRDSLRVWTEAAHPSDWAMAQNNLGIALRAQGAGLGGSAGVALLGEAVEAYRDALRVRTEATHPVDWAMTQNNLGIALRTQGAALGGSEGAELFGEAVGAYRDALRVRTEATHPVDWATTQNNLGSALQTQGERLGGAEGAMRISEAVSAYLDALRVRTEGAHPVDWAMTTENLGLVNETLAGNSTCDDPSAALEAAIGYFIQALNAYDSETMPYDHARASAALARVRAKLAALPDPA